MVLISYFDLDLDEKDKKRLKSKKYNGNFNNYFIQTNNTNNILSYKILQEKRDFCINKNIGCFIENLNDLNKNKQAIFWHYWEYFANHSPIWKNRFEKYNCRFKNQIPVFNNDTIYENFYEIYGYEPDEQNKETQIKSTLQIPDNTIKDWMIYIFEQPDVDINIKKIINY